MSNKKLLKFSAKWCGPCKAVAQSLETLDLPFPIEEIDVDINEDKTAEFKIRGVPTLVLLEDGVEIKRVVGSQTAARLKELLLAS